LHVGRVVLSTARGNSTALTHALAANAPDWHAVSNRKDVMALPGSVTKATGLAAAAKHLGVARRRGVAVGDAENDVPLLLASGFGMAVADAVAVLKEHADLVTAAPGPAGVVEVVRRMLADDLPGRRRRRRQA